MTTANDVTGDSIKSKATSDSYRDNWEKIFNRKEKDMVIITKAYPSGRETVEIPKAEYDRLKDSERKLECLESVGVDNWVGFDIAMEMYHGEDE